MGRGRGRPGWTWSGGAGMLVSGRGSSPPDRRHRRCHAMPFGFHPAYLVIVLAIVLIIFGPGKLPELGSALGRGIREFQRASDAVTRPAAGTEPEPDVPAPHR